MLKNSIYILILFLVVSCASKVSQDANVILTSPPTFNNSVDESAKKLNISEYVSWVKQQNGLTFDESENENYRVSIVYKPLVLESAISVNGDSLKLNGAIEAKKDYCYFTVECLNKIPSASNPKEKKATLLQAIKNGLHIIKNEKDTVFNYVIEEFPSSIMNQPDQLIILVSNNNINTGIRFDVTSHDLGINDLRISIPKKQFDIFPQIKL